MISVWIGCLLGLLLTQGVLFAQTDIPPVQKFKHRVAPEYEVPERDRKMFIAQITEGDAVFQSVQRGIAEGALEELTRHFAQHIYLNVRGVESGYYSANQAHFVLQNFFSTHRPQSFSFTTYGESGGLPYATGRGSFNVKGSREFIQVYVALAKHRNKWVVSQFNIY